MNERPTNCLDAERMSDSFTEDHGPHPYSWARGLGVGAGGTGSARMREPGWFVPHRPFLLQGDSELKLSVHVEYIYLPEVQKPVSDELLVCQGSVVHETADSLPKKLSGSNMHPTARGSLLTSCRHNLLDALGMHVRTHQWASSQL